MSVYFSPGKLLWSPFRREREEKGSSGERKEDSTLWKGKCRKAAAVVSSLLFTGVFLLSLKGVCHENSMARQRNRELSTVMRSLSGESKLYVVWGNALNVEELNPLTSLEELRKLTILAGGWLLFSPVYDGILERFGIRDVYRALYEKDNVFLICRNSDYDMKLLQSYLKQHYDQDVVLEKVLLWDNNRRCVVKIRRKG
jgi:hypothetical protein